MSHRWRNVGGAGEAAADSAPMARGFVSLTTRRQLGKALACGLGVGHAPVGLLGVGPEASGAIEPPMSYKQQRPVDGRR